MSRRRRQSYSGCSVEARRGKLRLRFRVVTASGTSRVARETGYDDTPQNREHLGLVARLIGAAIGAGKNLEEIDALIGSDDAVEDGVTQEQPIEKARARSATEPNVRSYYESWIEQQIPVVRRAQARDYKGHMRRYILDALGDVPLSELRASDVRGFQAELLAKGKSVKYARNIIAGTLRAMMQQARADELVTRDVFAGLKWPAWEPPEPEPLTAEERAKILQRFKHQRYGFSPGPNQTGNRWRPHPDYHGFFVVMLWTGMRPSEVAGLTWGDVDIANACLHVRRSRHLFEYNAPKTRQARRRVELFPEVVRVLGALQPLHVEPDMPVFKNTRGLPIEPNSLLPHWYRCLRALGIRQRGLYACKDTFVSMALGIGVKIAWLEQQTGVRYDTLRRHYGKWIQPEGESELGRFQAYEPGLFERNWTPQNRAVGSKPGKSHANARREECERGDRTSS